MKKKRDAYQLYSLKLKQEENEMKNFIKKRNEERNRLLEELANEEEKIANFYKEIAETKRISNQLIFLSKTFNEQEKEKKMKQIQQIEYELKTIKNDYLRLKNKREELEEKSLEKRNQMKLVKEKKEIKRSIEEGKIKNINNSNT